MKTIRVSLINPKNSYVEITGEDMIKDIRHRCIRIKESYRKGYSYLDCRNNNDSISDILKYYSINTFRDNIKNISYIIEV